MQKSLHLHNSGKSLNFTPQSSVSIDHVATKRRSGGATLRLQRSLDLFAKMGHWNGTVSHVRIFSCLVPTSFQHIPTSWMGIWYKGSLVQHVIFKTPEAHCRALSRSSSLPLTLEIHRGPLHMMKSWMFWGVRGHMKLPKTYTDRVCVSQYIHRMRLYLIYYTYSFKNQNSRIPGACLLLKLDFKKLVRRVLPRNCCIDPRIVRVSQPLPFWPTDPDPKKSEFGFPATTLLHFKLVVNEIRISNFHLIETFSAATHGWNQKLGWAGMDAWAGVRVVPSLTKYMSSLRMRYNRLASNLIVYIHRRYANSNKTSPKKRMPTLVYEYGRYLPHCALR